MVTEPTPRPPGGRAPGPLVEIEVGDDAIDWESLGFAVDDGVTVVGTVRLRFAGSDDERGRGIVGWTLRGGGAPAGDVDGLPTAYAVAGSDDSDDPVGADPVAGGSDAGGSDRSDPGAAGGPVRHPNGVAHIDHVVVMTPDIDRTTAALATVGLEPRRTRAAAGGRVQRFFRLGEVILEVVGPAEPAGEAPASFWGLAFTVADIDATAAHLAGRIGEPRGAVQQGRRIATVRTGDEVSVPIAVMSAAGTGGDQPAR